VTAGSSPEALRSQPLRRGSLAADPLRQFSAWFDEAAGTQPLAEAAAVATATLAARPSVRMVLVKAWSPEGLVFYTNYESRKADELEANPVAALLFHWPVLGRQVRIDGSVARVDPATSNDYFAERPRGAQLGAWASRQSRPVAGRSALEAEVARLAATFGDRPVPRPESWGGYRVVPDGFEFWQNRDDRLHDRFRYDRHGEAWRITRLQP
jgi:pyridoxamine 5'-phosphate oxidase